MKKFFGVFVLAALLAAQLPAAALDEREYFHDADLELFTATVSLLDMGLDEHDNVILVVGLPPDGEAEEVEAAAYCPFIDDRKNEISPADFLNRYKGETITIDFLQTGPERYLVHECRAGSK